jgi:hypothetical protein
VPSRRAGRPAHVGDQVRAQRQEPGRPRPRGPLAGRGTGRDDEHVRLGRPGVRREQVRAQAEGRASSTGIRAEEAQQFPAMALGDSGGQEGVVPPEGVQEAAICSRVLPWP